MGFEHWILDGKTPVKVDRETWMRWLESGVDVRRVARTQVSEDVSVSTVFLTSDHNFTGRGAPVLFETMIFGGPLGDEQWRYSTWEEAEAGHAKAVLAAKVGALPNE